MVPQPRPEREPSQERDRAEAAVEERFVALVAARREGEAAALLERQFGTGLARRLGKLALALGGGDEAEHLAHWAVSVAVTKGASFDRSRGSLSSWLYFLARNLALSQVRKVRTGQPLSEEHHASTRTVESRIQNRDAFLRVWRRIGSETLRQVLFLDLKHHGQAPGAAARELGLDRATFYKRRCEARRAFRDIWQDEYGDPAESFYGELE